MPADETIDEIIERVAVDAYGDEGDTSFVQAFEDEIDFPFDATLVGIGVEVRCVDFDGDERRGLLAEPVGRNCHQNSLVHPYSHRHLAL